ncbi:MAG: leucyl aminopeptidase [Patescibacteria group bacterium]
MIYIGKTAFPAKGDTLIFFIFEGPDLKDPYMDSINNATNKKLEQKIKKHEFTGKKDESLVLEGGELFEHVILYGLGKKKEYVSVDLRDATANVVRLSQKTKSKSIHIYLPSILTKDYVESGKNITLGFKAADYRFDRYKSEKNQKENHSVSDMYIYCESKYHLSLQQGIMQGEAIANGIYLTRDLVNEPASSVHPETLVKEAFKIKDSSKGMITVEVLDEARCLELGMGAFLGVAQGSHKKPKFIILRYKSSAKQKEKPVQICLIGKSITFDSGGLSLKPSKAMEDMKIDMAGGATVLGIFKALPDINMGPCEIWGILPACENMPSGNALRPGDIVRALNGKTIEVLNTDAEGRLILADAVSYAESYIKPDIIIDFATLTGACMVALGEDIASVFGNNRQKVKELITVADSEHESAWELPLYKKYSKDIKSMVADLKNVTGRGYGGAITGALFISEFVDKTDWIHIDIAGPAYNSREPYGIFGKGGTGWGIISIISYIVRILSHETS